MENSPGGISENVVEGSILKEGTVETEEVKACEQSYSSAETSQLGIKSCGDTSEKTELTQEMAESKGNDTEGDSSQFETNKQLQGDGGANIEINNEELRRQNVLLEENLLAVSQQRDSLQSEVANLDRMLEVQRKEIQLLGKDREQQLTLMREMETERDQYKVAKVEGDRKAELLLRQKEDFEIRIRNLTSEKDQLSAEMETLKSQLKEFTEKNAVLETTVDEMQKNKRLFKLEKEQWEDEKELYLHNKTWFLNEIRNRDAKLSIIKVESIRSDGELQAERASLSEYCESLKNELDNVRKQLAGKASEIVTLNQHLKEVVQEKTCKYKELECELLNTRQMLTASKESNKRLECQLEELKHELANRNRLFDEAKKEYEALLSKFDSENRQHQEAVARQDGIIKELRKEILEANELLKSKHHLSLTDQEVSDLSPAAAAASALIKNGVSLTEIYRQHCHVIGELEALELEKKRLEEYVNQFVEVLEEKAPLLVQQKLEYEQLNKSFIALREQLKSADEERQCLVSARDSSSRELAYTKAELEKAQRDNDDLAKQVRHLLYSIECSRSEAVHDSPTLPADSHVLWSSIEELQKVNQKLMSDLHSVKANHEQIIQETNQAEINRLNEAVDEAQRKMNLLKEQNEKQELIIKQLQDQRNTYKRLMEEKASKDNLVSSNVLSDTDARTSEMESKIQHYESCLKTCREEKLKSDQVLRSRIEQQCKLITQLRMTNAKLEADFSVQRQSEGLNAQRGYEAAEVELIKGRCERAESAKEALEKRLCYTESQLLASKTEVGQLKSQVSLMGEQINFLRLSESHLRKEVSVVRESNYNNGKMAITLQQIRNRCEKAEEIKQKKLEEQMNVIRNENQALKNYINEITEKHRIVTLDLKMACNKVEIERDRALASKKLTEDRFNGKDEECKELQARYDTLVKQSELFDTSSGDKAVTFRMEMQDLRSKNVSLENELKNLKNNLEAAETKLTLKEEEVNGLKKLSEGSQSTSVGQSMNMELEVKYLKSMLQVVSKQLDDSLNTISDLRMEKLKLEQHLNDEALKMEQFRVESQRKIINFEKKSISAECLRKVAESDAESALKRLKEIETEIKAVKDEKKKFEDEINCLEEKLQKNAKSLKDAEASKVEDEMKIQELRRNYQNEIAQLRAEHKKLEDLLEESRQLNGPQKSRLEQFCAILNKLGVSNEQLSEYKELLQQDSDPTEVVGEEVDANPLKSIIKILRDENHESLVRSMDAEVQKKRLEAQVSLLEEGRFKLEEELKKLQQSVEVGARALSENKLSTVPLSLFDNVKRENDAAKKRCEEMTLQRETMSRKILDLEARIRTLESEKTKEKYRSESIAVDLQNYRKEAESWKERHAEAMAALSKIGPEKVVSLTGELEAVKRQLVSMSTELENSRNQTEETASKHKSETEKLTTTIQQLRVLAKNYKAKFLALSGERESLQKELSELKLRSEAGNVESENISEQNDSTDLNNLRQQLLTARHEMEKLKQASKLASNVPRTGWPVDAITGVSSLSKGPSVLQAQMKQIESLSNLNKDLKNQLESLATRLKTSQDELSVARSKIDELEKQKEDAVTEKETKEEELRFRLNSITSMMIKKDGEVGKLKAEVVDLTKRLEEATGKISSLESTLEETHTRQTDNSSTLPGSLTTSNVSESASTGTASSEAKPVSSSAAQCGGEGSRISPAPVVSEYSSNAEELSAVSVPEEAGAGREDSSVASVISHKPTLKLPSVSTTSDKPCSGTNNTAMVGLATSVTVRNFTESESISRSEEATNGSCGVSQKMLGEKNILSSNASVTTRAYQSCTVSQSSVVNISPGSTILPQNGEAADQNGSGDEVNVISSSGVSNNPGTSANFSGSSSSAVETCFSSLGRKRPTSSANDQASSVESGSELQETVKRQRIILSEQVSTSGRILQQNVELKLQKEKAAVIEEDSADPEQLENVETTTSPEDEVMDENYGLKKKRVLVVRRHGDEAFGNQKDEEGDEEGCQGVEGQNARDEEALEYDEQDREEEYLDEALGGGEEYKDEVEDDEDYEDEGDDEGVEEEVPDIRSQRPLLTTSRLSIHQQQNNEEDEVSHSHSPADQSTDEADEGPRTSTYRPDTSIGKTRVKKENDAANEDEVSDHLELQQTRRIEDPDRSNLECRNARDECSKASPVVDDAMELTRADTTAHSVDLESDNRGASSTVAGIGSGGEKRTTVAVVRNILNDEEGDNEVAEEEHCTKSDFRNRTGQTDDEAGMSEASTSGESRQRRTRILYPDVDEPSSSSSRGTSQLARGRRAWPYRVRRNRLRRCP